MVNRHNYEEFFLLYADDELNHQQRAAVELFVQQNPDMAAELEMIKQLKLEPEGGIVFPGRESLYKTTDVEININNYEEFFLLYVDRELDEKAAAAVETFVLQHPHLQSEFTLLKQTVLQAEAITFADKASLYRKEGRKVGYLRFVNMAAAAAVIGLALTGWWLYLKSSNTVGMDGGKGAPVAKSTPPVSTTPAQSAPQPQVHANPEHTPLAVFTDRRPRGATQPALVQANSGLQVQQQPVAVAKIYNTDTGVQPTTGDKQATGINTAVKTDGVATHIAGVETGEIKEVKIIDTVPGTGPGSHDLVNNGRDNHPAGQAISPAQAPAAVAQTVAYREIDTHEDDRSMYVGALDLNKDKVKGLFRWAGRLLGAKPKKDID